MTLILLMWFARWSTEEKIPTHKTSLINAKRQNRSQNSLQIFRFFKRRSSRPYLEFISEFEKPFWLVGVVKRTSFFNLPTWNIDLFWFNLWMFITYIWVAAHWFDVSIVACGTLQNYLPTWTWEKLYKMTKKAAEWGLTATVSNYFRGKGSWNGA